MMYVLILAGGQGTRLWPSSRNKRPKQFLALVGERTMLQEAYHCVASRIPASNVLVATARDYVGLVAEQLPDVAPDNIISEPEPRGTAAAIALAAALLVELEPDAVMAVMTADHLIRDQEALHAALAAGAELADSGWLVTLGIRPTRPDSGYGYLQRGESLAEVAGIPVARVARFVEKPDLDTAANFVAAGTHDWNSGMFIWRADRVIEEVCRSMPDLYKGLMEMREGVRAGCSQDEIDAIWRNLPVQTIDYGVMEKASDVAMLSVDIGWTDIGTWESLYEILPHDAEDNALAGQHLPLDTRRTLIFGNGSRRIATIGLSDMVIVDTEEYLLVCPRERVQEVRRIVSLMQDREIET